PVADVATLSDVIGECSATVTFTPTATDACAGTIYGTTSDDLYYDAQGTYTITWTYDDGNGNSSVQYQTVVVDDVTAPVADAGSLTTLTGECFVDEPTHPTATDNCVGTITASTTTTFPAGTGTIIWIFDDGNGNISTQEQQILVDDVTAPVADAASLDDLLGECSVDEPTAPTATDNCSGVITGISDITFPITTQGTYTVTWTFEDLSGNISTQTQNVIIADVNNPTITCVDNQVIDLLDGQTSYSVTATEFDAIGNDNCNVASIVNDFNNTATLNGEALIPGTYTITWTVTDDAGNTEVCTSEIVVNAYVGLNNISLINISLYPNPSTGIFTIQNATGFDIVISDVNGKIILTKKLDNNTSTINLSGYANGIYFIEFSNKDVVKTMKLIKNQ
ncbi:MAG: T9SS type A sorting domain-containing protein, partial [Bacteroidales bacterium]|nr:T9SS type A sorting domain-containing protein [Bacteroidales bacterium]